MCCCSSCSTPTRWRQVRTHSKALGLAPFAAGDYLYLFSLFSTLPHRVWADLHTIHFPHFSFTWCNFQWPADKDVLQSIKYTCRYHVFVFKHTSAAAVYRTIPWREWDFRHAKKCHTKSLISVLLEFRTSSYWLIPFCEVLDDRSVAPLAA